jgi:hypothetical protein
MRHSHGLRAAARGGRLPEIGEAYEGGFFAGYISHTANGIATHGLIVAPAATGYNGQNRLAWKTTQTSTAGTTSSFDGAVNSANMNNASHPAGQYCEERSIGGYDDWYLPARYELSIAYFNLKPTTSPNNSDMGINPYSVPARTVNYTAGAPAQTSVTAFQDTGTEDFFPGVHVSSTEASATAYWNVNFLGGTELNTTIKTATGYVRAFRKFAL